VVNGLSLVVGADRGSSPLAGNGWRTLLGINRALDLALPVHRRALVKGVVFDDRNGNGRQDDGEPGIACVTIRLGDDERTTSTTGEFSFSDWSLRGQRIELDPASIPQQFMAPQRPLPLAGGTVVIPLVRSGALTVMLRAPRGDESATFEEDSYQSCAVSLIASDGRTHEVAVDNGVARFGALAAGGYQLVLTGEETERRQRIQVPAGESTRINLSCPGARLTRFGPTASR